MKKLFLVIAIPVIMILGAVIALVTLVNPNQFKPLIVEQAKVHTGLDLVIEGDIRWQFFPSIGFQLGQTELRNPQGFEQKNMFKVDTVGIDVSVMPLFSHQLDIGNVTLDGAAFSLETLSNGKRNIDVLMAQAEQASSEKTANKSNTKSNKTEPVQADKDMSVWTINLAGVSVSNAAVEIKDKQKGSFTKLYDVSLNLSQFAIDHWTAVNFAAKGQNNQQTFTAQGEAEFKLAQGFTSYALRNVNLDASFRDPTTQIDSAKIGLATFEFNKANALTYAVAGKAAGLNIDMQGFASLQIDKAMTKVSMQKIALEGNFEGDALPQSPMKVSMASDLSFDLRKNHLRFVLDKLTANALAFDGNADLTLTQIPKVRFALHSPNLDLDEFLGVNKANESKNAPDGAAVEATGQVTNSKPAKEVEPDLSALKTLDVKGEISIDKFKANNAHMEKVKARFSVNRGIAQLISFNAKLYQGAINASARLDAGKMPAHYSVSSRVQGVKVQPLLVDVANKEMLEGTGNIDANLSGHSLTPTGIKNNLFGTVKINFADGAVNGINIAQIIRENYAKFKGQKLAPENTVKKTDFSSMKATLKLNRGSVTTNDLHMQSPLLRIGGKGSANYLNQTVDFTVSTSVVGSLKGQGGKDIDELRDVTIPINISGAWTDPRFKLVFDDVLKQKAKKELDRGLKKLDKKLSEKIKDEKTREAVNSLLKGLFN